MGFGLWAELLRLPWADDCSPVHGSRWTQLGNLAASLGPRHGREAMLGSNLAKRLADASLVATLGRFMPRLGAAVLVLALLPNMQAEKSTGRVCHFFEHEHCQLVDEWLALHV